MFAKTLFFLIFATLTFGCANVPVKPRDVCKGLDWFEIGRNDAAIGRPTSQLQNHQKTCDQTASKVDPNLYMAGFNAGLVDYCTLSNGLEVGKRGLPLPHQCPEPFSESFQEGYRIGIRIHNLESENKDLQSRIESLIRMRSSGQPGNGINSQLEQLQQRRAQIDSEISNLEDNSIKF